MSWLLLLLVAVQEPDPRSAALARGLDELPRASDDDVDESVLWPSSHEAELGRPSDDDDEPPLTRSRRLVLMPLSTRLSGRADEETSNSSGGGMVTIV